MRAKEFILESNIVKFNGLDLSLEIQKDDEFVNYDDIDNQVVYVTASSGGKELGQVLFTMDYDSQGLVLNPQDLEVNERFRGQGIAQTMYDFVKSKGYRIRRSGQQTDAGRGFWDKHRPEVNVWEDEQLDEGLRDWIAALAATGAIAMGSPAMAKTAPVQQTAPAAAPAEAKVDVSEPKSSKKSFYDDLDKLESIMKINRDNFNFYTYQKVINILQKDYDLFNDKIFRDTFYIHYSKQYRN